MNSFTVYLILRFSASLLFSMIFIVNMLYWVTVVEPDWLTELHSRYSAPDIGRRLLVTSAVLPLYGAAIRRSRKVD